jgi:hypothetical protein
MGLLQWLIFYVQFPWHADRAKPYPQACLNVACSLLLLRAFFLILTLLKSISS